MSDELDIDALVAGMAPEVAALFRMLHRQNEELKAQNAQLLGELAELRRLLFGRKAERVPDARRASRKRAQAEKTPEEREAQRKARRKRNREKRKELPVDERVIEVPIEERVCPSCGDAELSPLGEGAVTEQIERVPEHFVRIRWVRKRYACGCGKGIVTANPPPQVKEGCEYGPGLHAHVVVSKCQDALPLYRQAKRMERAGICIARATLCTLFHRPAELLEPIYKRILEHVKADRRVAADETPLPVLAEGGCKRGYVWTFTTKKAIAFAYSASRSGDTPKKLLGGTDGVLLADAYSGYNAVTGPSSRTRAACWAHVRRNFFRALETAPEAAGRAMDEIGRLYDVEHRAAEKELVGTPAHRRLRQDESKPIVDRLFEWLADQQGLHPPKSPFGKAAAYALRQQGPLRVFLESADVPLDNNGAERALKPVALGRKNFLFAGHDEGAENLAVLQTLVATCQLHGIDPEAYIQDLLVRVHSHPAADIDALMPWDWQPAE